MWNEEKDWINSDNVFFIRMADIEQLSQFLYSIHKQVTQLNENDKKEIAEYMIPEVIFIFFYLLCT